MGYVSSIYNCVPVGERPAKCVSCLNSFFSRAGERKEKHHRE